MRIAPVFRLLDPTVEPGGLSEEIHATHRSRALRRGNA
jgi:hypothetical protein